MTVECKNKQAIYKYYEFTRKTFKNKFLACGWNCGEYQVELNKLEREAKY